MYIYFLKVLGKNHLQCTIYMYYFIPMKCMYCIINKLIVIFYNCSRSNHWNLIIETNCINWEFEKVSPFLLYIHLVPSWKGPGTCELCYTLSPRVELEPNYNENNDNTWYKSLKCSSMFTLQFRAMLYLMCYGNIQENIIIYRYF